MRHIVTPLVVLLTLCASLVAEVDTGYPVDSTPYDHPFAPMRQVYARFGSGVPSISEVRAQLRTAYRFRYYFDVTNPYTPQLPEVTEARQEGDCKAKSLWLADKMHTRSARYALGKARLDSKMAHVWLMWLNCGNWLLLDPVNSPEIIQAERVTGRKLFTRYSYVGGQAWKHPTYHQYFP